MKTLRDHINEAESWVAAPAVGDDFAINIREECLVESHIVDVVEDGVVLAADEDMMRILESYGLLEEQGMAQDQKNEPEPKTKSGTGAKPTTSTHCPGCYSTDIKTYSDGEKECHQCHKTWHVKGVAEGKFQHTFNRKDVARTLLQLQQVEDSGLSGRKLASALHGNVFIKRDFLERFLPKLVKKGIISSLDGIYKITPAGAKWIAKFPKDTLYVRDNVNEQGVAEAGLPGSLSSSDYMLGPRSGVNLPSVDTRDLLQKRFETYGNHEKWLRDVNRVNRELLDDNAEYISNASGELVTINGKRFAAWSERNGNGDIEIDVAKKYREQGVAEGSSQAKRIAEKIWAKYGSPKNEDRLYPEDLLDLVDAAAGGRTYFMSNQLLGIPGVKTILASINNGKFYDRAKFDKGVAMLLRAAPKFRFGESQEQGVAEADQTLRRIQELAGLEPQTTPLSETVEEHLQNEGFDPESFEGSTDVTWIGDDGEEVEGYVNYIATPDPQTGHLHVKLTGGDVTGNNIAAKVDDHMIQYLITDPDYSPEYQQAAEQDAQAQWDSRDAKQHNAEDPYDVDDPAPMEAKYQGREVPLGKPMAGDVKKSKVYVKGPKGNVVKVNFGDKKMRIKKSNPKRRKSFRARHNCANPGPRWKARYWSCRAW
jgi:hypothetical protein